MADSHGLITNLSHYAPGRSGAFLTIDSLDPGISMFILKNGTWDTIPAPTKQQGRGWSTGCILIAKETAHDVFVLE